MPSYGVLMTMTGLVSLVFAPYWARLQQRRTGDSLESGTRFSRWFGAALIAVALIDYGSTLLGWGSIFRVFGVH